MEKRLTPNQKIAEASHKAAPSEWLAIGDAPIDAQVVCKREGAWIGAVCQFDGVQWHFLSAPDIAHSDPSTLNPMQSPTHWKPLKKDALIESTDDKSANARGSKTAVRSNI